MPRQRLRGSAGGQSLANQPVRIVNPAGAVGQELRDEVAQKAFAAVFAANRRLGPPGRVRFVRRDFFDPLPIE